MSAFSRVCLNPRRQGVILLACALVACTSDARPGTGGGPRIDDYGDSVAERPVARPIVSLNPATTEILFALGAGVRVVGRSRWDQWPPEALAVPDVGDAIRPSIERVLAARPDLVVLYAGGDNRDGARALRGAGVRVVALRIDRIADFTRAVTLLGALSGTDSAARTIVDTVTRALADVRAATADSSRPTVFIHAWENPLIVIGGGSFMSELVEIAGGHNVYADLTTPSAPIAFEDVVRRDPDAVLAGPQVAAHLRSDPRWRALRAVREQRILVYDTTLVARPSVKMGEAAWALARLLHPGLPR